MPTPMLLDAHQTPHTPDSLGIVVIAITVIIGLALFSSLQMHDFNKHWKMIHTTSEQTLLIIHDIE